jgi:hypothetical protein
VPPSPRPPPLLPSLTLLLPLPSPPLLPQLLLLLEAELLLMMLRR